MAIKATEISDLIRQRIENFKSVTEARNVGSIVVGHRRHYPHPRARGCVLRRDARISGQHFGLALNLEQDRSARWCWASTST